MARLLWLLGVLLLTLVSLLPSTSGAVMSTFDSDLDGWTGSGAIIAWQNSQGNPPGSISSHDNVSDWAQIIAPAKFHGAWPVSGYVAADIKFAGTGSIGYPVVFAITDGNTTYEYVFSWPTTEWVTYVAYLNSSGWTRLISNANWYNWNPPIGVESLADVLKNVTDFRIRTDYVFGFGDFSYIDNIMVVPVPSGVLLLAGGLAGLAVARRHG